MSPAFGALVRIQAMDDHGFATLVEQDHFRDRTFLPTPWTDITPSGLYDTDCDACPAAAFCVLGAVVPQQCPAGTFQGDPAAEDESACQDCPEGFSCSALVIFGFEQCGMVCCAVLQEALVDLTHFLGNLSSEEAAEAVTFLDYNGRAPLHKAAMEDDVEILDVLLQYGGAGPDSLNGARDADGFTAVMQALLLDNIPAVTWLVSNGATVTDADVILLTSRDVDAVQLSSVPVASVAPDVRYLGRGSYAWTGPAADHFGGLEKALTHQGTPQLWALCI
eukprot:Skav202572  [mRNA]  locus=scaffold104:35204:46590:- [translate_table: standard]